MKIEQITTPELLPVSLESIKEYLRILDNDQDDQIVLILKAGIKRAEDITNLQLGGVATFVLYLDAFPSSVQLPKAPFWELIKIEYVDTNETVQQLDTQKYDIDTKATPARLFFFYPPKTIAKPNSVIVTYKAGYEVLPEAIEMWLKVEISKNFDERQGGEQKTNYIDRLLDSYRIFP